MGPWNLWKNIRISLFLVGKILGHQGESTSLQAPGVAAAGLVGSVSSLVTDLVTKKCLKFIFTNKVAAQEFGQVDFVCIAGTHSGVVLPGTEV